MAGGGGGGGGRALRQVDSKRYRLSEALRELRLAAKARDKDGLLRILVTGHRGHGSGSGDGAAGGTSTERGVAAGTDDADQRARQLGSAGAAAHADGPLAGAAAHGGRRCASSCWALAVALVLVLACVVALGKAPAICCCTCVAWWCSGGAQEYASGPACRRRRDAPRSSVTSVVH